MSNSNLVFYSLPVKVTREYHGANIIVGVSGRYKKDVLRYFNGIYNMNGCPATARLCWVDNGKKTGYLAKFQTTEERFLKGLINLYVYMDGMNRKVATKLANGHYEQMERDQYLNDSRVSLVMTGW